MGLEMLGAMQQAAQPSRQAWAAGVLLTVLPAPVSGRVAIGMGGLGMR
jgi:hypothetical protein